ncbi:MAG: protease modulator HflC [Myxococcales bacterium]|nr:protease modulator HflC [Myxococcales bacterium]
MRTSATAILVIVGLILFGLSQSTFVVNETDQVVITQFGRPVGDPVTSPGLNFKVPFVQQVHRFDKRFIEWDGERNQLPTRDKRFIFVDTYARWAISDPLKFFQRLRDERGAQTRLDDILDGETRNVIARHDLIEVVRTSSRDFAVDDEDVGGMSNEITDDDANNNQDFRVDVGREKLAAEVLKASQARTADLGIEILDFQFKRINYVKAVQAEVYTRMISERKRIAEQFRSEGAGSAARISGEKERELARITSEAFRKAEEIRGGADAKAADIYAAAYNRNPQLYSFLRSMETFRETVDEDTVLLLETDGELLQYLQDASP